MAFKPNQATAPYRPRGKKKPVLTAKPVGKLTAGLGKNAPKPTGFKPAPSKPNLGAPPAPAAAPKPAEPVGQHAAPDSLYNDTITNVDKNERDTITGLDAKEVAVKNDFGIDDPSNPFSRANGLKRAFLARQKGVSAGLASQGQLYSGAHERALSRTRFEEAQARDELRRSYEAAIGSIGAEKAGVKFNSEQDRLAAFESWLQRAPDADAPAEDKAEPAAAEAPKPNIWATGEAPPPPKPGDPGTKTGPPVSPWAAPSNSQRPTTGRSPVPSRVPAGAGRGVGKVKPKPKTPVKPKGKGKKK